MTHVAIPADEHRRWGVACGIALAAHLLAGAAVLGWSRAAVPPVPEPVVLVELPPAAAAVSARQPDEQPRPDSLPPQTLMPPIDIPPVKAPLPRDAVTLPPPPPPVQLRRSAPAAPSAPVAANPIAVAPAGAGTGTNSTPGDDPKARAREADYYALISAHLNRKKRYPKEAKKALQEGIVTVRFTVHRDGSVSNVSIKRGSGHELLDRATLDLMQRVAPLPRMPSSMKRDSVMLSLPIDYSLKTS
ncbi:MAG: energy transducer TonB [Novosphingobium sp.]|nr:energy transducer TonB [Novosphingobium sp.]MCP5403434.1 energy transducer TonB [Novosphingobium sp.]